MENLPSGKKDIIIKCKLEEMVQKFFKDWVIIWHDPNLNSPENQQYKDHFVQKFCEIKTFTKWKDALNEIMDTEKICHVITSGTDGELLVREIDSNRQVSKIYVFCRKKDYHTTWSRHYEKICCVETKILDILGQIQQNLLDWYKEKSSLRSNLPAFVPIFNDVHKSRMNHIHRFLKVIPNFKNRDQAKDDFFELSWNIFSERKDRNDMIKFKTRYGEYDMVKTLKWYTRESFLYKVTNNCLRIATSDSIQYCRLLLKDLQSAIREQYKNKSKHFNGLLYRSTLLSEEEWLSLKENEGKEIEMLGFLSGSKEENVALGFMQTDPSRKVFITIIVPGGLVEEEQGFAEIDEFSQFPQEKEVLFNVRSRFTVLETEEQPYRRLVLFYGAQGFRRFTTETNPVQQVKITEDILRSLCKGNDVLIPIADSNINPFALNKDSCASWLCVRPIIVAASQNSFCFQVKGFELMKRDLQIPFYGYKCFHCQSKRQKAYYTCIDCGKEKHRWCENCYENITLNCVKLSHTIIYESKPYSFWFEKMSEMESSHLKFQNNSVHENDPFQQALMYSESHEYEKANEYYEAWLEQNESINANRANCFHHLGVISYEQKEDQKALKYYFKSLKITNSIRDENCSNAPRSDGISSIVSWILNNQKRKLAIASTYNRIGMVYTRQEEHQEALEYFRKSLEIRKSINGEDHVETACSFQNIAAAYYNQKESEKAFEYYYKAFEVRKLVCGEDHPYTASFYSHVGRIFNDEGEYQKALEFYLKSLNITKSLYGENHPQVAYFYDKIAAVYENQKDNERALEYYFRSLEVKKSVYKENHPDIADSEKKIFAVYKNQGEYWKAFKFLLSEKKGGSINKQSHPKTINDQNKFSLARSIDQTQNVSDYYQDCI